MTDRSATDILLDIELKLDELMSRVKNTENLQKILVKRINQAPQKINTSSPQEQKTIPESPTAIAGPKPGDVINKDNFDNRKKTSKFSELAAQHGLEVEETKTQELNQNFVAHPGDLPPDPKGEDMVEAPVRQKARGQRGQQTTGGKVPVSQILQRDDGGPLFLANIEIMDENDSLINQGRTNTKGRWLMPLIPGNYQVHVSKRYPPDSGRESIDMSYTITIPPSDKPMELDPLKISG